MLAYNHPGQLAGVEVGGTPRGVYKYDYLSRLVSRELPASSTTLHLVHDLDGNVIAEYDSAGTLLREYVWLDDRPIAAIAAGTPAVTYWVHTDHLERPVMMTDDADAIVWQASYLPYGEVSSITGSASLDYRFPGQWFQLESGLHYNWNRHYDPTTGRYVQPDPLGMPDGPSRWAYGLNSPLMNTDREGRQSNMSEPLPLWTPMPLLCGDRTPEERLACVCSLALLAAAGAMLNEQAEPPDGSDGTKAPPPNNGISQPHGSEAHDKAINDEIEKAREQGATNIRKNQVQTDINGNRVGDNRPDVQYDLNGKHHNIEFDGNGRRSKEHGDRIISNDPGSHCTLNILGRC